MQWLDLIIRILFISLGAWAIRWGIIQQTKSLRHSIPTLPDCTAKHEEIKKHYTEEINRMREVMESNLNHVAELITKDLERGQQKFKEHGKSIEEIKKMINDMRVSLAIIAKNEQRQPESTI